MKISSIKTRLVVTIMVTTLLSLSVACLVYSLYDLSQYRSAKKNELKQLVNMITPLLVEELTRLDEHQGLWQELVAQNKGIQRIVVYRLNFTAFDEYAGPTSRGKILEPAKEVCISFAGDYCIYLSPIVSDGKNVGYIAIDYLLLDRIYGFRSIMLVFVATFLVSTCIAYFISTILQAQLNRSIASLVDVAKSIYQDKNYKARAVKHSNDEFGLLTDTINEMLDEISRREVEMHNLNDHLESRVETRTEALQSINSRLLNEKKRADQASTVKSDFLANISHEIRTPMNGIVASCDLAVAEDLSPKVANYLKIIQSSSHSLLHIINDILDFSKLEAGTLELEESPFSLSELVCKIGAMFKKEALHNNIELILDVDSDTPDVLVGDRVRFQQILCNLLDNGIKFTHQGQVSLRITCLDKNDDKAILECCIEDTGVGLSEDGMKAIFQSFHQVDSSSTRQFGGTGLGLPITKKLASMMGGTIEVSSHLGQGSSFTVTLRFGWNATSLTRFDEVPVQGLLPDGNVIDLLGKHVLLVEGDEINRGVTEVMLTGFGLTVDSVENGELALVVIEETDYDFVLLDIERPVLGGYQTIERIRGQHKFKDLIIIVLTAHALSGDKEKCLQAGANGYLSKPLSQTSVKDLLCSFEANPTASTTISAQPELSTSILDIDKASSKLGVAVDVYLKVLSTFYFDYENIEVEFTTALEKGDLLWFKKKIHSLKGSSGTIGAKKLTAVATSLDQICKRDELPGAEQVQQLLFELSQVITEAKQFLVETPKSVVDDGGVKIIDENDLAPRITALAQALDESLYDQINIEIRHIEKNISGSKVTNLGKMIRMYAYDEALILLQEISVELGYSFDQDIDVT